MGKESATLDLIQNEMCVKIADGEELKNKKSKLHRWNNSIHFILNPVKGKPQAVAKFASGF